MSKIQLPVRMLPGAQDATHIEIRVDYAKGGTNIWNGADEPRGMYLYVKPVEIDIKGMVGFILGRGVKKFLEPMARLNRKRVAERQEQTGRQIESRDGIAWEFLQVVLAHEHLALVEPVPV